MLFMEENKKKITRQRDVNVHKNITKLSDTLVKRLLILKNELIFVHTLTKYITDWVATEIQEFPDNITIFFRTFFLLLLLFLFIY